MGRITTRKPVVRIDLRGPVQRRPDALAVEEPLEIRIAGAPLAVTMRTPGHDVELAAGFLVSEGIIAHCGDFAGAIHCGGPGTGGAENTYNVLDVALAPGVRAPSPAETRAFYTTSSCGVCGKASIEAVETVSHYDVASDDVRVVVEDLVRLPDRLRERQDAFTQTGGLHAAALFDGQSGELLVAREDVGRHNAVDKVIGWAVLSDRRCAARCCRCRGVRASNSCRRPRWPESPCSPRSPRRPRSPSSSPSGRASLLSGSCGETR
jgi:FdhD protein